MTTELTTSTTAGDLQVGTQGNDWGRAAAAWLANLKSDNTRRAYLVAWQDFTAFAQVSPDQVTQDHVIAYRRHLTTSPSAKTGRPLGQTTVNQRLSALSAFFAFAQGRGLRDDNPVDGVTREAVTPYGKATWLDPDDDEDRRLLRAIDPSTTQGRRDRAIVLLFLTQALRVDEVASLTVGSLRRQGQKTFLTYTRKGGETEEVILAGEAAEAIDAYLADRPGLTPSSPLFTATDKGRRAAVVGLRRDLDGETHLTDRAIRYLVKHYCDRAFGRGHGIHPHSLRHTAAQVAAGEGLSVTDVSRLLKHSSTAVTTIYLHSTRRSDGKTAAVMGRRYSTA